MMEFHVLKVGSKCNLCDRKLKIGNSVIKRKESNKIVCMLCLVEICERTNEPTEVNQVDKSLENVKCPECGGPMASRKNHKTGSRFWGCLNYPVCKGTRDTDGLSKQDKEDDKAIMDWNKE